MISEAAPIVVACKLFRDEEFRAFRESILGEGELTKKLSVTAHSFSKTAAYSERTRTKMFVQDLYLTSRGAGPLQPVAALPTACKRPRCPPGTGCLPT